MQSAQREQVKGQSWALKAKYQHSSFFKLTHKRSYDNKPMNGFEENLKATEQWALQ